MQSRRREIYLRRFCRESLTTAVSVGEACAEGGRAEEEAQHAQEDKIQDVPEI